MWYLTSEKVKNSPPLCHFKDRLMNFSEDGFIQRQRFMEIYMPYSAHKAIGQIRVSFHELQIGQDEHFPYLVLKDSANLFEGEITSNE